MIHMNVSGGPPLIIEMTQPANVPFFLNVFRAGMADAVDGEDGNNHGKKLFNHFDLEALRSKVIENGLTFNHIDNGFRVTSPYDGCTTDEPLIRSRFCSAINGSLNRFFAPIVGNHGPLDVQMTEFREPMSFFRDNVVFNVLGTICFLVCFSLNEALSGHMLQQSLISNEAHNDIQELTVDSLSEICNTVVGNAFSAFDRSSEKLRLGTPIVFQMEPGERLSSNRPVTCSLLRIGPYQMKVYVMKL